MDWIGTIQDIQIENSTGNARAVVNFSSVELGENFVKFFSGPIDTMMPDQIAMQIAAEIDRLSSIPGKAATLKAIIGLQFEHLDTIDHAREKKSKAEAKVAMDAAPVEAATVEEIKR